MYFYFGLILFDSISPPAPYSEDTYLQVSIIYTSRFDPLPAKVKINHL